jgi:aspartate-semialdehyde dehydrogenase
MSSEPKISATAHADQPRASQLYRVAIVGAGSLMGKEVAEVLNERNFPSADVKLLDDDESLGKLESVGDEVTFIQKVGSGEFRKVDFSFFASDPASTRKAWKIARDAGSAIIDFSGALEDEPGAEVRSPWMERQLGQVPVLELQPGPAVVAHPAAVALALLMFRLHKAGKIQHALASVFVPASELGQKGMDELHEQTVNLLSFQPLPKNIFDMQVAFNMVSRYGEHSAASLTALEARVLRHYRKIGRADFPPLSLLFLQAPIFHGYGFALHVELDVLADIEQIAQVMAGEHIQLTHGAEDAPTNVSAAGQNDLQVSLLPDAAQPNALWLWVTADNLRIAATTGVECAESMATTRPRGKIQ